jgi:hypothetical protein
MSSLSLITVHLEKSNEALKSTPDHMIPTSGMYSV